jgi:hypothetical protein
MCKITHAKRAKGVAQVVEHLPSKLQALSSYFNTVKKRKERKVAFSQALIVRLTLV